MANDQEFLQLSLFGTTAKGQINYIALYDLAPRFAQRNARMAGTILTSIKREFPFGEDLSRSRSPRRALRTAKGTSGMSCPANASSSLRMSCGSSPPNGYFSDHRTK